MHLLQPLLLAAAVGAHLIGMFPSDASDSLKSHILFQSVVGTNILGLLPPVNLPTEQISLQEGKSNVGDCVWMGTAPACD